MLFGLSKLYDGRTVHQNQVAVPEAVAFEYTVEMIDGFTPICDGEKSAFDTANVARTSALRAANDVNVEKSVGAVPFISVMYACGAPYVCCPIISRPEVDVRLFVVVFSPYRKTRPGRPDMKPALRSIVAMMFL
jgi:hypothetical protein